MGCRDPMMRNSYIWTECTTPSISRSTAKYFCFFNIIFVLLASLNWKRTAAYPIKEALIVTKNGCFVLVILRCVSDMRALPELLKEKIMIMSPAPLGIFM